MRQLDGGPNGAATAPNDQDGGVRTVTVGDRVGFHTSAFLAHAARQARERGLSDVFVFDADAHHREPDTLRECYKYIEDPVLRHRAEFSRNGNQGFIYQTATNDHVSGRIVEPVRYGQEQPDEGLSLDITVARRRMASTRIAGQIMLPSVLLELATHPITEIQVGLSWAYSRWLTEDVLPREPRLKTMVYLPFCDPDACVRFIEYFSGAPGVLGFLLSASHYLPLHHNSYMKIYRALEECAMPLAIHAALEMRERAFEGMDNYLSRWAAGMPFSTLVHVANLVAHGIPERFPGLKLIWMGGGLAWVPYMMSRLDSAYGMRTSEAPSLEKRPSEYMREFYYASHPIDIQDPEQLALTLHQIRAETQLLYASGMPSWDFNLPSAVDDLPGLDAAAKRRILGQNARELFRLSERAPEPDTSNGARAAGRSATAPTQFTGVDS